MHKPQKRNYIKDTNNLIGITIIASGLLGLAIAAPIPENHILLKLTRDILNQIGSSLLAIGILETIFKTYLQEELISRLIAKLQQAIHLPVKAIYLRRSQVPPDLSIFEVWDDIKDIIYIKAAAYSSAFTGRVDLKLRQALTKNPKLKVRFLILDPKSDYINIIAKINDRRDRTVREGIQDLLDKLKLLEKEFGDRLQYRLYDSFPTCNIWIVDPHSADAWARISPRITENRPLDESIVIFLSRNIDPSYYNELYNSILDQWEIESIPSRLASRIQPSDCISPNPSPTTP